ncbi:MinD/ParA family protein [Mesobacillus boroniphilus]|uniref:MinD/ParA family protein n=2 Tax=Mesobacillus boroniphilus TaxID=308892 RepID=A0A944GXY2_9BACI|nr:MinD/ParA family protein [Mesobacillus boroniphilus]
MKRGELIAVCSAKGGIGRTVLTVNLAGALVKKNISVAILDGDFQFGDIGLAMDLKSAFTIKEVIEGLSTLDEHSLAGYMSRHESGVKVMAAPDRPEYADLVTKDAVDKILDLMLLNYDYVVVDTSVGLNEHTVHIAERADQIMVMANLEMSALKNTKLLIETFDILELRNKVTLVVNRANMESVIKAEDAARILGYDDPVYIPNDFQTCSQSLNIGIPFVMNQGKTDVAKAVFKMAERITSRREITLFKEPKGPSFLSKLIGRKRMKGGTP